MSNSSFIKDVKKYITIPPGLPSTYPTKATWQEPPHPTVANAQSPTLAAEVDVVIIGSGVTGTSVAHSLLHHPSATNLRVTMLEARTAVSGATGRNGGHLVSDSESLFSVLSKSIGLDEAIETVRFSEANLRRLKELISQLPEPEREAVEFREVIATTSFGDAESFQESIDVIKELQDAVPDSDLTYKVTSKEEAYEKFQYGETAGVTEQYGVAALWPYRLMTAILAQLQTKFSSRFTLETMTPVLSINHSDDSSNTFPYTINTPRGSIRSKKVIHCTNGYSAHLIPNLVGKLYPLRGTMSTQKLGPSFPVVGDKVSWCHISKGHYDKKSGTIHLGLYYAQQNARTGDMFLGGEAQKLSGLLTSDDSFVAPDAHSSLCAAAPTIWKDAAPVKPLNVWSGIMGFTADGMPLVGQLTASLTQRTGSGEWVAAGFNGHGMDKCWLSGEAVARMALGENNVAGFPKAYLLSEKRFQSLSTDMAAEVFMEHIVGSALEPDSHL